MTCSILCSMVAAAAVHVDFGNACGEIKPIHGVNCSPVRHETVDKVYNQSQTELAAAGVPYCRLHDVAGRYGLHHYVDIPNVFPNFDADENDPANYDFAFTDAYLKTMVKVGVKPYYRLGATIENTCEVKPYNILPPKDPAKWARICEHVIAHYNEGWADGYRWNVEYWEIWNEPEPNWSMWYRGTKEQFFELYETAAKHLKKRFPNIKIGGYGSIGFYAVDEPNHYFGSKGKHNTAKYAEDFLDRMKERNAPLDFFSWHLYLKPPFPLERIALHAKHCREILDERGFTATESHFNEWNVIGDVNMDKSAKDWDAIKEPPVASQVAAAFAVIQNSAVDKAMYYSAIPTGQYCGMFYWPSGKTTPVYEAFVAFDALYRRKAAFAAASDEPGVYALAAKSDSKGEAVMLCNISREEKEIALDVAGASGKYFSLRRIDERHRALSPDGFHVLGRKMLLPPSSVTLLERVDSLPPEADAFVEDLLAKMTLHEKIGQLVLRGCVRGWADPMAADGTRVEVDEELCSQIRAGEVGALLGACGSGNYNAYQKAAQESRLRIPLLVGADLIHGCRTTYPIPLGLSAAWDVDLWRRCGELISKEAPLVGCNWTFAPMVDIARDARWGRIAEGPGQDPFLGGLYAAAMVKGIQRAPAKGFPRIAATLKHFVAYGAAEGGRDYDAADISDGTLHNVYLPPFKGGVDAGAFAVMSSFQTFAGEPVSVSRRLLTDILRGELGFNGLCVSDMGAIGECGPSGHAVAEVIPELAAAAVKAGLDVDMERRTTRAYADGLFAACQDGLVRETDVDACVRHVLSVKRKMGLFESSLIDRAAVDAACDLAAHRALAREAAARSAVLLKNANGALPIAKSRRIALVGAAAADTNLIYGTWTMWHAQADRLNVEDGLKSLGMSVVYTPAYGMGGDERAIDEAALSAACAAADVVVACFGINRAGGEAQSRSDLSLAACERRASEIVAASGKPFVAVLFAGIPVAIPELAERADAILDMWGPGSSGGIATADVLTGKVAPSGRLTCDFPYSTGQCPIYYNHLPSGRPFAEEKHFSCRYADGPTKPLYPFGHGLTYTAFDYSATSASGDGRTCVLSCTVSNTGDRAGREVVQAYVRRLFAGRSHPVRELKGFKAVELQPGEKRRIEISLDLPPGDYDIVLAPDSASGTPVRWKNPNP